MKMSLMSLALVAAMSPVLAQADTINFTGEIVPNTCSVAPASQNMTVTLGKVDLSMLQNAGDEAAHQDFPIVLNCSTDTESVGIMFSSATQADNTTGNLTLTGAAPAKNVQVRLWNLNGDQKHVNRPLTNADFVPTTNGAVTLTYRAGYYATGAAEAGLANTNATFTVMYQ